MPSSYRAFLPSWVQRLLPSYCQESLIFSMSCLIDVSDSFLPISSASLLSFSHESDIFHLKTKVFFRMPGQTQQSLVLSKYSSGMILMRLRPILRARVQAPVTRQIALMLFHQLNEREVKHERRTHFAVSLLPVSSRDTVLSWFSFYLTLGGSEG